MAEPRQAQPTPTPGTSTRRKRPEYWAERTPDFPAAVDGDEVLTYAQWNDQANRLADALQRFAPGAERACVRLHQSLDWFVIQLALNKARCEHIAVNWRLTPPEVAGILADADAAIFFFDDQDPRSLVDECANAGVRLVSLRGSDPRATELSALIAAGKPVPVMSEFLPMVTYSSGTTGTPKGTRPHPARDEEHRKQITEFTASSRVARPPQRGRTLLTLPLHHGIGPKSVRTCHEAGGTVYLLDRYDPVRALEIIAGRRITHWKSVPAMLARMRVLPPEVLARFDVTSMRAISVGSAPTPWTLKEWVLDYFGPVLHEGYGASEVGMVSVMRPEGHRRRPGSCGRLRPHVKVRVIGPDGAELPPGQEGELLIRTPVTIAGYLNPGTGDSDLITPDGFFRSGDIGRLDPDNFLYITGRIKDMIIAGGVNIYPAEIEAALADHPDVVDAAVIGIPEPVFGEQPIAFCELRPGATATPADLTAHLQPRLAPFKQPRQIHITPDLPRNDMGKIIKQQLRAPYWTQHDTFTTTDPTPTDADADTER
jgi:long-chain acyl-CoA synthetase